MKQKLFTLLFVIMTSVGIVWASEISVDGIWYIFDDNTMTATVTYRTGYSNTYTGDVVIPASVTYNSHTYCVTSIGYYAFRNCSDLTSITIGFNVTNIEDHAFIGCSGLTCVIWNAKNCADFTSNRTPFYFFDADDKENNFDICRQITSFIFGDEVEHIPANLCRGMFYLTSVIIPNSATSIGAGAFYDCRRLTSIDIPNSVTNIGESAFYHCIGLTSPIYNDHIFAFMPTSFSGDYSIPCGIESIAGTAFYGCTDLTNVTIPESVTSIGIWAFCYCSGLTSVTIPNSVTSIGNYAFEGCSGLTSVHISDLAAWCAITFYYSNPLDYAHHLYLNDTEITDLIIPEGVTSIGSYAFRGCTGLTSVTIPNSVTSIGSSAFYLCRGLTSVTLGNSVANIGYEAFTECSGLTAIYNYSETPQVIDRYVFSNVNKSTCTLYVPEESIELYRAADGWKEFGNIVDIDVSQETELVEEVSTIRYVDKNSEELHRETVMLHVPAAPIIEGFTFVKWQASGNTEEGIVLQAVYEANTPTSVPAEYVNPANKAQKLIRNGNVYILTDTKTYTVQGQEVK